MALKSQLVYTCDFEVATSARQNCIELRDKNRQGKRALIQNSVLIWNTRSRSSVTAYQILSLSCQPDKCACLNTVSVFVKIYLRFSSSREKEYLNTSLQ